jgi:hypothetical protein
VANFSAPPTKWGQCDRGYAPATAPDRAQLLSLA